MKLALGLDFGTESVRAVLVDLRGREQASPSVSIWAMTSPEPTESLAFFRILTITPSAGDGSSSTTLSVSISIRFSSRETFSPSFLCQSSSVASETDSESCGTFTSMMAIFAPVRPFPGFR